MNLAVKRELGRFPVDISCLLQALKYLRHLQSSDNTLLQEALSLSTALHNGGVFSWVSFFKNICDMAGVDPEYINIMLFYLEINNAIFTYNIGQMVLTALVK